MTKCGNYKCNHEAKYQRSDLSVTDPTDPEQQALAHEKTRCGIHGPGPEKRSNYQLKWGWVPIEPVTKRALALRAERKTVEQAAEKVQRDIAEHERQAGIAKTYWERRDNEPEYLLSYEEETRYYDGLVRKWVAYDAEDLARRDAYAIEHPDEERWVRANQQFEISVRDESPYDDVTYPASLRSSVSSEMTPKLARLYAEALSKAVEVVEAMNVRLREKHNQEVTK
jgi:hypothetical protein